jgi:hypothetical protein
MGLCFAPGTPITTSLLWGVSVTLAASAAYAYLKVSKVLEPSTSKRPLL